MSHSSVLLPFIPTRPEQAAPFAAFTQWRNSRMLWQGQGLLGEQHQVYAHLAGLGLGVPFGLGVSLMPFRHPLQAAVETRSLAAASGHPVVAGFGPGAPSMQQAMLGAPYKSPLTAAREYLMLVRGLLDGHRLDQRGEYFSFTGSLPPLPTPRIELGLGVLRPGMARLAGEVADVAITWLTPPAYLRERLLPALRSGAERAGRRAPRVVAIVPAALAGPDRDVVEVLLAGSSAHLQAPHYRDMLRQAGVLAGPGSLADLARGLIEADGFVTGAPRDAAARLDAYRDAGVDEVVINTTGVCQKYGPRTALGDLEALFAELGDD
ncbi:LLM class flavin-dependent oxidoreductase [Streptomyces sioyaensis]|uniref:LLM class flavin-dependent oxidoreductase n=1 Tax=Streptomyces sioyaensis TaxID=67364 RepID=UPI003D731257